MYKEGIWVDVCVGYKTLRKSHINRKEKMYVNYFSMENLKKICFLEQDRILYVYKYVSYNDT